MEREGRSSHGQANAIAAEQSSLAADEGVPNPRSTSPDMGNPFSGYGGRADTSVEESSDCLPPEPEQDFSTGSDISEYALDTHPGANGDEDVSTETSSDSGALESIQTPGDYAFTRQDIEAAARILMSSLGAHLGGVPFPIETLHDLTQAMQCFPPNRSSVTTLTQEAVRLQGMGRNLRGRGNYFAEFSLLTHTFTFLQATMRFEDVLPTERLRMFYSVLWLTDVMVGLSPGQGGMCYITQYHDSLDNHISFWRMSPAEVISFCQELDQQLRETFKRNTPVTVCIMRAAATILSILETAPGFHQPSQKRALVNVFLLHARCFLEEKYYEDVRTCCRESLRLSRDYCEVEALMLWARALQRQQRLQMALEKAMEARNAAHAKQRHEDQQRIERMIESLQKDLQAKREAEIQRSKTIDWSWLQGTNAFALRRSGSTQSLENNRRKSRHKRPKARQQNEGFHRSQSTSSYQRQSLPTRQSQQAFHANNTASANQTSASSLLPSLSTADLLDDECSDSDLETVSSEEPAVKLNLDHFRQRREEYQVPTRTWFEESQTPPQTPTRPQSKSKTDLDSFDEVEVLKLHPMEVAKFEEKSSQQKSIYAPMKSRAKLVELLRREPERYKHCKLRITSAHSALCRVVGDSGEDALQLEVCGRSRVGQTYNDDEVVVEVLSSPEKKEEPVYGQVVGILKRHRHDGVDHPILACVMDQHESQLMHPLCKTVPKVHVLNPKLKKMTEVQRRNKVEKFEVTEEGGLRSLGVTNIPAGRREEFVFRVGLIHWGEGHHYPLGVVLGMMAEGRNFPSGMRVLEFQHTVPRKFPPDCVQAVDRLGPSPLDPLKRNRNDLTELLTFTIDPPGSRDLDDALSVRKDGTLYEVWVHIADVSSVVEKGNSVDVEARRRGCTFYPPGGWRTYPMLPEPLSQGRCSLLPGEPRPTLSLLFRLDDKGEQHGQPQLCQAVIRSSRQLTYTQAQDIIDGRNTAGQYPEALVEAVRTLHSLAVQLRQRRLKGAARHCRWEDPRLSGREEEEGAREAHALVEEFMVKTNLHIAQRLFAAFPDTTLLRSQDAPKADELRKWLETGGATCHFLMALQDRKLPQGTLLSAKEWREKNLQTARMSDVTVRRDIWHSLQTALEEGNMEQVTSILSSDDRHPLQQLTFKRWAGLQEHAVYRCSNARTAQQNGELEETGNGHFFLGAEAYGQFTSPIRRYADLVLHRMVKALITGHEAPYDREEIRHLALDINRCSELAKAFSKSSRDLHLADCLQERPLQVTAVIDGVSEHGLDLLIPGMRSPPQGLREVPFNLLTMSEQPLVENDVVRCKWRQRIFHALGNLAHKVPRARPCSKEDPVQVNERHLVVTVSARRWGRLLEAFLSSKEGRLQSLKKQVDRVGPEGEKQQRPCSRNNISCESGDGHLATQVIWIERTFAPGQAVHVQLGAGCERGMLVPRVSLLWLSDNLHLCLDHVRDPIPLLAAHAAKAWKPVKTLSEFAQMWIPLLKMEAVTACVQEDASVLVEHVQLQFNRERGGTFTLLTEFCAGRGLDLGGQPIHRIKETATRVGTCTEYLCIRVPVEQHESQKKSAASAKAKPPAKDDRKVRENKKTQQNSSTQPESAAEGSTPPEDRNTPSDKGWVWIGHGHVTSIRRLNKESTDDKIEVTFELNPKGAPPPEPLLATPTVTGLVQFMLVAETERRAVRMLEELEKRDREKEHIPESRKKSNNDKEEKKKEKERRKKKRALGLIKAIALRTGVPLLDEDRRDLAMRIEKDLNPRQTSIPPNNKSQQEAIETALTHTFSLIQGPPGTGKTNTGVKLIYLFHKINSIRKDEGEDKKQVLFCGPSNKSVDVVAKLAMKHLRTLTPCPRVARMYGKSIEEQDFPVPGKNNWRKGGREGDSDPELRDITVHFVIRKEGKPYARVLREYDAKFKNCRGKDPMELALEVKRYNKFVAKATMEELTNYDVIFCTCSVAGNRKLVESTDIFQVIIDECGMCPEPHCLVPVIANCARQVVLIGDHKQLRPIIRNRDAAEMGLETSLFERYALGAKFLNTQYRMHRELCAFPSKQFYNDKLETEESRSNVVEHPLTLWPDPNCPHVLVHVEGEERVLPVSTDEGNEMSRSNDQEVDKVVQIVERMVGHEKVGRHCINVMSQYNAQCHVLRDKLKNRKLSEVKVSTVVASQGGEWDYVVFSTVRSLTEAQIEDNPTRGWSQRHLGFITDQNQINVALTRARRGLIIVGNAKLLEKDPVWKALIERYRFKDCLRQEREFPPPITRHRFRLPQPTSDWQTVYKRPTQDPH